MNIPNVFSDFLEEIGVFSPNQAEDYSAKGTNNDEDKAIFKLADFFKALTPSDCYDLALRLYLFWKKALEESQAKKREQETKTISSIHGPQTTAENTPRVPGHRPKTRSFSLGGSPDDNPEPSERTMRSMQSGDIFERLHNESFYKNYTKRKNEEMKLREELKECTFKPKTSKSETSRIDTTTDVFERLQKDHRKEREEINASIRAKKEMEGCTFHPQVHTSHHTDQGQFDYPLNLSIDHTFERLYRESNLRKQLQMENELKKQEMELKDCTFKPVSTARRFDDKEPSDINERIQKLYNLHFEQQRNLAKKRLELKEKETEGCTFTPSILSPSTKPKDLDKSMNAPDRLLKWEEEKKKKLQEKRDLEARERSASRNRGIRDRKNSKDENRYEKLYKDGEVKKHKIEELEKKVLREIGASFTPKVNSRSKASPVTSSLSNLKSPGLSSSQTTPNAKRSNSKSRGIRDTSEKSDRSVDKGKVSRNLVDRKENIRNSGVLAKKNAPSVQDRKSVV